MRETGSLKCRGQRGEQLRETAILVELRVGVWSITRSMFPFLGRASVGMGLGLLGEGTQCAGLSLVSSTTTFRQRERRGCVDRENGECLSIHSTFAQIHLFHLVGILGLFFHGGSEVRPAECHRRMNGDPHTILAPVSLAV